MEPALKRAKEITEWIKENFNITVIKVKEDFKSHEVTFEFHANNQTYRLKAPISHLDTKDDFYWKELIHQMKEYPL